MLATSAAVLPCGAEWAYELKWDGIRALVVIEGSRVVAIRTRNGNDVTDRYPELAGLGAALGAAGSTQAVLDGEIVATDAAGRPSFGRLQQRMGLRGEAAARAAFDTPVVLMVFDVLVLDSDHLTARSYAERRQVLEGLALKGPSWSTTPSERAPDRGVESVTEQIARKMGLEGVVAKRLASSYVPGTRSTAWRKVKWSARQEFVVGGWVPGTGARSSTFGALLVGYYDNGALVGAGRVGGGFRDDDLRTLRAELDRSARASSPFTGGVPPPRDARFVEPRIVVEVRFGEWTDAGALRHPVFLGVRHDKHASEVGRET